MYVYENKTKRNYNKKGNAHEFYFGFKEYCMLYIYINISHLFVCYIYAKILCDVYILSPFI